MKCKITEKMFKAIKIMLNGGASTVEAAEYMGVSDSTVSNIKHSETYEEYKHKVYVTSGYYRKKMALAAEKQKKEVEEKEKQEKQKIIKEIAEKSPFVPAFESVKEEPQVQVVEHRQSITLMANHYLMEEVKKQTELLVLISNKIAFIVDELTK